MNSELMEKLESLLNKFQERALSLKEEYASITSIDNDLTKEDISRIKEIKEDLRYLSTKVKELTNDIDKYKDYDKEVNKLSSLINSSNDEGVKYLINKDLQEAIIKEEEFARFLEKKYNLVKTEDKDKDEVKKVDKDETNDEDLEEEKKKGFNIKKPSKKTTISIVAILAALGLTVGVLKGCTNKNNSLDNQTEITDTLDNETNNEVKEILEFGDINDEEQVSKRAAEIKPYFDTYAKEQNITQEDIENFLRYINGGVVDEVSYEAAGEVINQINLVLSNEMAYSIDKHNNGYSNREKNELIVDYGKFFLDESNGQRLANKINEIRSKMILTDGDITEYQKQFTELLKNSWYLHGYNEIDAYSLETSGMSSIIDIMFLDTTALAIANEKSGYDITVKDELGNVDVTLLEMFKAINDAKCEIPGEDYLDTKFNSDFYGMVAEAAYNKQNSNNLTLN